MTKAELATKVAIKTGLDAKTVSEILDQAFTTIKSTVATGDGCYFRGFGSFTPKVRARKTARNIARNETIIVPEHNIAHFKPSPEFSEAVKKLKV